MKQFFTISFLLILSSFTFSQALSLGSARNETAPGISQESTLISVTRNFRYCRFVPGESATYTISSVGSLDGMCRLYNSVGALLIQGDNENGNQFVINYSLSANQIYYLAIKDLTADCSFTLNITGGSLVVPLGLQLNSSAPLITKASTQILPKSATRYCRFVPQINATYTISSIGSADAVCDLYDETLSVIAHGDDENGLQFIINYSLIANQTYYLGISDAGFPIVPFTLSITGGPLPVQLTSFEASVLNEKVVLNWKTATEINNYGFEIERSQKSGENKVWEKVGFVEGNGNCNSPKEYSFIDENPEAGLLQYRLKQIDLDGNFEYFHTLPEVNFGLTDVKKPQIPNQFNLLQNYPNPFNPSTKISYSIPENQHVIIKLYSLLGKEIMTLVDEIQTTGNYEVTLNGKNLSSGMYFYQMTAGKYTAVKKMILSK